MIFEPCIICLVCLCAVNMVNKQDPTPEFQIQQEDFPALPGAQSKIMAILSFSSFIVFTSIWIARIIYIMDLDS